VCAATPQPVHSAGHNCNSDVLRAELTVYLFVPVFATERNVTSLKWRIPNIFYWVWTKLRNFVLQENRPTVGSVGFESFLRRINTYI
jgi:hypothetical protein